MPQLENKSVILYPGSGIDFSPILMEFNLKDLPNQVVQEIRLEWSLSTLVMCDNSPLITHFFQQLEEGTYIFNKATNEFLSEPSYKKAWVDSDIDSLQLIKIELFTIADFRKNDVALESFELTFELSFQGQVTTPKVVFLPCSFEDLMIYTKNNPNNIDYKGLFIINLRNTREILEKIDTTKIKFIIADEPAHRLPETFLHSFVRFKHIAQGRHQSHSDSAILYLNEFLFKQLSKPVSKGYWIIPGLFFSTDIPLGSGSSLIHHFIKTPTELTVKNIQLVLNEIDEQLAHKKTVLLYGDNFEVRGTILACWLIRHLITYGDRTYSHITKLEELSGCDQSTVPIKPELRDIIQKWSPYI